MPAGRPQEYNRKEVLERLRDKMATGVSMQVACEDEGMPDRDSIFLWVQENDELFGIFMRAQELWCLAQKEVIIEIADNESRDYYEIEETKTSPNGTTTVSKRKQSDNTAVNRDNLRVKARQWAMTKLAKKHFGEEVKNELTGPNGGPIKYEPVDRPPPETHEQWTARVKKQIKDK